MRDIIILCKHWELILAIIRENDIRDVFCSTRVSIDVL